ncbi:diguanylate cyclase [Poseidonibacter lekithochrous]|uniref:sensor domain-containing diguanylate cyclase n=1 Tax=Poseidonibacter TaxID=2321187 RepID=UPI001C089FC8|nr:MULTISPECIES: diguanylate cyclase [Poseidonibacter]MBU3014782.1 diguanylate cyclase [Poseidonibacter lekithochrous]MDO6828080.1 diguanylate cyclase [Poseidonibacter sp. 1_MG-2023]
MFKIYAIKNLFFKNIILTILFAILITVITSIINYNIKYLELNEQVKKDIQFDLNEIEFSTKNYFDNIEDIISSILKNDIFTNYLINKSNNKEIVSDLFKGLIQSHKNIFQLRFIDAKGFEKIKLVKERNSEIIYKVDEKSLQNKSNRYYFKDTVNNKDGNYFYSQLDLNIENKKIEKPIRPTMRISSNIFHKGIFYGIIIANVDMEKLLSQIKNNNNFNVYMIDKSGNFIIHPNSKKAWNKYLNNGNTIFTEFNLPTTSIKENNIGEDKYIFSLENYFKNNEDIKLIFEIQNKYLDDVKNTNLKHILILALSVLIVSIILGLIISIPMSKIYINFNKLYKQNLRFMSIINSYVITMTVGLDKKILDVSDALCDLSKYKKEKLIGEKISIFNTDKTNPTLYKEILGQIINGNIWEGEIKEKSKDNTYYWLKSTILPNFDEHKKIISFTSISENITDKKTIEILSQTDKLTQLSNRHKMDECLISEFDRFKRAKTPFSILLIDVDKFKEVNDNYGHQVGDIILIELSKILKENSRKIDIVGRWGGEEFLIICTNTNKSGAIIYAEKIRKKVEEFNFPHIQNKTISIGVSEISENDTLSLLIKRADDNLYLAKKEGRNKIVS